MLDSFSSSGKSNSYSFKTDEHMCIVKVSLNVNTVLTRVFSLVMPTKGSEESFRFVLFFHYIEKLGSLFLKKKKNNNNNNNKKKTQRK